MSSNEIDEAMREIRPQIKEMMTVSMQKTQAFAYRDLPDEELQELAKSSNKKTSKGTRNLSIRELRGRFTTMGENLGKDMARLPLDEDKEDKTE